MRSPTCQRSPFRFCLSTGGYASAYTFHTDVGVHEGERRQAAMVQWSRQNCLELDDGLYLGELSRGPLTYGELGEAVAIFGHTQEMVAFGIARLLERELVCSLSKDAHAPGPPSIETMDVELVAAEAALAGQVYSGSSLRLERAVAPTDLPRLAFTDRYLGAHRLAELIARVDAARRSLVGLRQGQAVAAPWLRLAVPSIVGSDRRADEGGAN